MATNATIVALAKRFPKTFVIYERRRRPLKVWIHSDIVAAAPDIPADELSEALRVYTGNIGYLHAGKVGAARVDLAGAPAGVVSEEEARHAADRVAKWRAKRAAPPPKPASSAQSAQVRSLLPESPASPKRLSIADLKSAWRARTPTERVEEFVGAGEGKPVL